MTVQVIEGDCRAVLRSLPDASFHSCVTDPPYHLSKGKKGGKGPASANPGSPAGRARITTGFMGAAWDGGDVAADLDVWREVFRVLKPGAYLLAFGGTRTFHRMVCAIEDAGFEIRDCIRHEQAQETWPGWVYGSGFPKSHNVAKAIDKRMGARGVAIAAGSPVRRILPGAAQCRTGSWEKPEGTEYQPHAYVPATPEAQAWQGWGTALKPAWEPICVARKPLQGTVAANVLAHGCGALNIDASRVPAERATGWGGGGAGAGTWNPETCRLKAGQPRPALGRWPANLVHDGSADVVAAFPEKAGAAAPVRGTKASTCSAGPVYGERARVPGVFHGDSGSAARFFYSAKANKHDRAGSNHPTVKPLALMRYLVRLVTPPGGQVLDLFAGSGTTGEAAQLEAFDATLIELIPEHVAHIRARLARNIAPKKDCAAPAGSNITTPRRQRSKASAVNITAPEDVHNNHYVAPEAST